ncbi:hypothetical protein P171DRAFT_76751 [Karstenula rhodostoma CBS 690.94]|uniref:Uncharacterized protein n=1 Tax=Karstenula rhodostoma CBS 690.94 TaxID=1392251 RepID=A0A9P4U9X9_9PLEO|nr:hypothetical protein P171DRAFT_76751 [Karstenula rhodostoma CBS 690.94]
MPSMVHAPLINTGFFKDKTGEHLASAFTAVNGRNSPPSPPPRLNASNGMTTNTLPRPVSRHSPEESKPRMSARDNWSPPRPAVGARQQNGYQNGHQNGHQNGYQNDPQNDHNGHSNGQRNGNSSTSPTLSNHDSPPLSPSKRKRSASTEGDHSQSPPDGAAGPRRHLESHAPTGRGDSPNTIAQVQQLVMDHQHPRTLPPVDRIDADRSWAPYNGYHES